MLRNTLHHHSHAKTNYNVSVASLSTLQYHLQVLCPHPAYNDMPCIRMSAVTGRLLAIQNIISDLLIVLCGTAQK
jgi:hypothetical protein